MKTLTVLILCLLTTSSFAMLNPVKDVNYKCVYPISIGNFINIGNSGNAGADAVDKARSKSSGAWCYCYPYRFGVPYGMNLPNHIVETTVTPYKFPSLNKSGSNTNNGTYRLGGSDSSINTSKTTFTHSHLHRMSMLEILGIFQDVMCMKSGGGGFDILYMSEIDTSANSSATAAYLFPEAVLVQNPLAVAACAADAVATAGGATFDPMYWCAGGHSVYPVSNFTTEANSFEDASAINMVKTMYRVNRSSLGTSLPLTAGPMSVRACYSTPPAPQIIKSQFRFQTAITKTGNCERIGTPSLKWNTPKRSTIQGDMVQILWTRHDCCAF